MSRRPTRFIETATAVRRHRDPRMAGADSCRSRKRSDRFVLLGAPDLAAGLNYLSVRTVRKNLSDPAWEGHCSRSGSA